tara:strand:- start:7856 stop:8917 length:1062 start_codon:yes stop_codon:yes gene_type:complete
VIVYASLFIIILLTAFLQVNFNNDKLFSSLFLILIIVLIFYCGLRGNNDEFSRVFIRYGNINNYLENPFIIYDKSLLTPIISIILNYTFPFPVILNFFYVSISLLILFYVFKNLNNYFIVTLLLYYSHFIISREFSGFRTALSSSFVLLGVCFLLKDNNKKKFYINYFISILIHYESIIAAYVVFLRKKIKNFYLIIFFISSFLISIFIYPYFLQLINELYFVPEIIKNYLKSQDYGYDLTYTHIKFIQHLIFLIIFFIIRIYFIKYDIKFELLFNIYFFSLLIQIIFNNTAIFAFRFAGVTSVVEPILIIYFIENYLKYKKSFLNLIIIFSFIIFYINYFYINKLDNYELYF